MTDAIAKGAAPAAYAADMELVEKIRAWDKFELGDAPPPPLTFGECGDAIERLRRVVWTLYGLITQHAGADIILVGVEAATVAQIARLQLKWPVLELTEERLACLKVVEAAGGKVNHEHPALARFCDDASTLTHPDVFNQCHDAEWLETGHGSVVADDDCFVSLTPAGRAILALARLSPAAVLAASNPSR